MDTHFQELSNITHMFSCVLFGFIKTTVCRTHPSFNSTGSSSVFSFGFAPTVDMTSRKCLTASTCFSVQNFLYSCPVYSSLHGCWADRELTKLPSDWIVFDISVNVRFVWKSCAQKWEKKYVNFNKLLSN